MKATNPIAIHLRWLRTRKPALYCFVTALESTVLAMPVAYLLLYSFELYDEFDTEAPGAADFVMSAIIRAPIVETLLLQMIPILLARRFGLGLRMQVLCSLVPFALCHTSGLMSFVCAGLIGGFYLSYTFAVWLEHSLRKTLLITIATHVVMNSLVGLMIIVEMWLLTPAPVPTSWLIEWHNLSYEQQEVARLPFAGGMTGKRHASLIVYGHQDHAIVEIGHVRIAIEGMTIYGSSVGGINIWPKRNEVDAQPANVHGVFSYQTTADGTVCQFGDRTILLDGRFLEIDGVLIEAEAQACLFFLPDGPRVYFP